MKLFQPLSLRVRIILLGSVLLIPLVLLVLARSEREANHEFALAQQRASLLAEEANQDLDDLLVKAQTVVEVFADAPAVKSADRTACDGYIESLQTRYAWANSLFVVDSQGRKICGTAGVVQPEAVAKRDWFRRAIETGAPVVGDYTIGMLSGRPQLIAAQPIPDSGSGMRVAAISIDLGALNDLLARHAREIGATVTILDRKGSIVARYPEEGLVGKNVASYPIIARILAERRGLTEGNGIGGEERIIAFGPFGNTSLTIIASIERQPIIEQINRQRDRDLTVLLTLAGACLAAALLGAERLILKPLGTLSRAAGAIGEGRFDIPEERRGLPEVDGALNAIDGMAKRLAERDRDLRTSEERFRLLADGVVDHALYVLDRDGKVLSWNSGAARIKGYQVDEILGQSFSRFYTPEDRANREPERILALAATTGKFEGERWRVRKDGSRFWAGVSITAMRDSTGALVGFAKVTRDLSERSQEEERRRVLIEAAPNGMLLVDASGTIAFANSKAEKMFGYTHGELTGKPIEQLVPPQFRGSGVNWTSFRGVCEDDVISAERKLFGLRRDETELRIEIGLNAIETQSGRIVVMSVVDVGERRAAEDALRRSEEQYRLLADNATDLIVLQDLEGRPIYISPACRRILGYEPEELAVMADGALNHPDDVGSYYEAAAALSEESPRSTSISRVLRRDGSYIWLEASMQLVPATNEEPARVLIIARDITARHRAEAEADQARALVTDAVETMQDGIILFDRDDKLVLANRHLRERFREKPDILTGGRSFEDVVRAYWAGSEAETNSDAFENFVASELQFHLRADGIACEVPGGNGDWYLMRHARMTDGGILTVSTDITGVKRAEAEATRAKALVVDAIEAMEDAVSLYDANERLVLANQSLLRRNEANSDLFVPGRAYDELIRGYWRSQETAVGQNAFAGFAESRIAHFRRADGAPYETEAPDGRWYVTRHFRTRDGGTISISTDITASKEAAASIATARDAAEEANRAKSAFLASMSHEIRTPMNGVIGFADLLLDTRLDDDQYQTVERIRDAGKSLLAIINDILDLSKIEAGKLELESIVMSPASIVDAAASMLKPQIVAKGLELRVAHGPAVPSWILGDPTRVRQILLNLMSNALKFTDSGHIDVRYELRAEGEKTALCFEVRDTGIGIPEGRQSVLFQDFTQLDRSTTRRYGGTGLGLSICKRLAEAMGGAIGVSSAPGQGSCFWFTMTMMEATAPAELHAPSISLGAAQAARILVAEDLPMNQLIVKGMLTAEGHSVIVVENGAQAVAAAAADNAFDLILMDMEMPEMDGIEATRAIRTLESPARDVPIIALTANAMLEDAAACATAGMNDFLAKPIDRKELAAKVAKWSRRRGDGSATAEPTAKEVGILDDGALGNLERLLGRNTVDQLRGMLRDRLGQMKPVFDVRQDRAQMARDAHDLISLAGNIGCTELVCAARDLLTALRTKSDDVDCFSAALAEAADRALLALERRFAA